MVEERLGTWWCGPWPSDWFHSIHRRFEISDLLGEFRSGRIPGTPVLLGVFGDGHRLPRDLHGPRVSWDVGECLSVRDVGRHGVSRVRRKIIFHVSHPLRFLSSLLHLGHRESPKVVRGSNRVSNLSSLSSLGLTGCPKRYGLE